MYSLYWRYIYLRRQKIKRCAVSTYLRHPEFNCKLNLDNFSLFGIWNSLLGLASISLGKLVLSGHIPSTIGTFLRKTLSNFSSKFFRKTAALNPEKLSLRHEGELGSAPALSPSAVLYAQCTSNVSFPKRAKLIGR